MSCGRVAFSGAAVSMAIHQLDALQERIGPFTAGEARAALGTTRRYAVPLLEHLRRTGVSTFDGSVHQLREPTSRHGSK